MKSFLKQVLAVITGLTLFQFVKFFLWFLFVAAMIGFVNSKTKDFEMGLAGNRQVESIKPNSILHLDLNYTIPERSIIDNFNLNIDFLPEEYIGLNDVLAAINKAANDDDIEGIYLQLGFMPNGYATIEALRKALVKFKETDKFVVAYGEMVSQKSYYLASVANEVYVNPEGIVELRGFGAQVTFFKKLLEEKLGIEMQVFRGSDNEFKSAVEPYTRETMSESNKQQLTEVLTDIYGNFKTGITGNRAIQAQQLEDAINNLAIKTPADAERLGLIDGVAYYDQVLENLMEKVGSSYEDLRLVKLGTYNNVPGETTVSNNKIAVLYAEGGIVSGKGDRQQIGSDTYARTIRQLRNNDDVDAIVFRINSGGGSALASDVIWREITLAKQEKPVVVTFGNVAASGGYYIACNADYIYAEPSTITGSIGVFGLVPYTETFMENKLGITYDEVNINTHANMNGVVSRFDEAEKAYITNSVETVYNTFISRVAEGRNMDENTVKQYAKGHIYSGNTALEIGLVDSIGGMESAVNKAAQLANLDSYKVVEFPKKKSPIEELFSGFYTKTSDKVLKRELGNYYTEYKSVVNALNFEPGVYTKLPYQLELY